MSNRRLFIQSAAVAAGLSATASTLGADERLASSAEANATADDGYNYKRPDLKQGCRLLFQGDSITDMKWGRNQRDRNHFLGHSYVYLIAARLGLDMPVAQLEFFNRGHSGNTVGDLRNRWESDAIMLQPDVLSVLIGVNDVGRTIRRNETHVPLAQWEVDYRAILDASREANKGLKIVLLDPFVLPSKRFSDAEYQKWRGETDKLGAVVRRLATDYQAIHIQTQQIFDDASKVVPPEHWIWDGVHPLPQGHELIARNWIASL